MKADIIEELNVPEKVEVSIDARISIKGPKGEVSRRLAAPGVNISLREGKVVLEAKKATRKEKKMLYTFAAHMRNMFKGVTEGHQYQLKICSGHFPMNVSVSGKELTIKNFLGEGAPRKLKLNGGVEVKVEGDVIEVKSADKELAGMTASDIELLTKIKNRDRRIFQDGIFIINKSGKVLV